MNQIPTSRQLIYMIKHKLKQQIPKTQLQNENVQIWEKNKQAKLPMKSEVSKQQECLLHTSEAILSASSFLKCEQFTAEEFHKRSIKILKRLLKWGQPYENIKGIVGQIRQKRLKNFKEMKINNSTIDFHTYNCQQLNKTIPILIQKHPHNLRIITGKGNHSNGKPVLKRILISKLKHFNIKELQDGLIVLNKKH